MASVKVLYQCDSEQSWFENISIRPNGNVLATHLSEPSLVEVDPSTGKGNVVLTIDEKPKSLTGICPIKPDVFAVGASIYEMGKGPEVGSSSIWIADFTGKDPTMTKVVDMPEISFINGITTWDEKTVLVTDCWNGKVFSLDVTTKKYDMLLEHDTMRIGESKIPAGVNGVKVHRSGSQAWLYYTNSSQFSLFRVSLGPDLEIMGDVEVVSKGFCPDDFLLTQDGGAYICANVSNSIIRVAGFGAEGVTVAGQPESLEVAGPTACVFGQGDKVLYVSTCGAKAMAKEGMTEPAKVLQITL